MVDQRRFDDQRWVDSRTAAKRLGISRRTLYAYVSRGAIRSVAGAGGRPRRYALDDIDRLRARSAARRGHGAVAAGALRWGEPVMDSAVTAITPRGPAYRGRLAVELAARGVGYEAAAELLWSGALPELDLGRRTSGFGHRSTFSVATLARLAANAHPLDRMALMLALDAIDGGSYASDRAAGRALIPMLAACLAPDAAAMTRALGARTVAGACARALGCDDREPDLDVVLVLLADHELNASSFAARVAASTGAAPRACVAAALATLTGPLHGRAAEQLARGDDAPAAYGHPLYPDGDPRTAPILALVPAAAAPRRAKQLLARVHASRVPPSVDAALAAFVLALGAPPAAASGLFAVARCAGWLAHAAEQRAAGFVLRPRARYVGAPVTAP